MWLSWREVSQGADAQYDIDYGRHKEPMWLFKLKKWWSNWTPAPIIFVHSDVCMAADCLMSITLKICTNAGGNTKYIFETLRGRRGPMFCRSWKSLGKKAIRILCTVRRQHPVHADCRCTPIFQCLLVERRPCSENHGSDLSSRVMSMLWWETKTMKRVRNSFMSHIHAFASTDLVLRYHRDRGIVTWIRGYKFSTVSLDLFLL